MKKGVFLMFMVTALCACSVESSFLSPVAQQNFSAAEDGQTFGNALQRADAATDAVYFASELSNAIAATPVFENKNLNLEISSLRNAVYRYLYANREKNRTAGQRAYAQYEDSFKKIQKIKTTVIKPDSDENELLNRFLTKIKTNMYMLESSLSQKSGAK